MKVLIGTTNTSKAKQFEELLDGHDLKLYTLKDLGIEAEPEEKEKLRRRTPILKRDFMDSILSVLSVTIQGCILTDCRWKTTDSRGLISERPVDVIGWRMKRCLHIIPN